MNVIMLSLGGNRVMICLAIMMLLMMALLRKWYIIEKGTFQRLL